MVSLTKNETEVLEENDPWARDKLNRKEVAEYLTPVIASIRQPFVISLHSEYGTGKSFFLESWKRDLENQGFKVALFNAWETDFSKDALSAFMASMKKQLAKDDQTKRKFQELAKKAGGFARSKLLPVVTKGIARKLVGDEGIKEVLGDFDNFGIKEEEIASLLSASAVEALAAQEASENSMKSFKEFLEKIAKDISDLPPEHLSNQLWENKEDRQRLIILVDELDRCRPTYAVEVLECIKHLFAVEGIVFVLAIDDEQMRNAISSVYGQGLDGDGYLRKFIDWRFKLPPTRSYQYIQELARKWQWRELSVFRDNQDYYYDIQYLETGIDLIDRSYGLTLREIEQGATEINLILRSMKGKECPFAFILGIVVFLKMKDNETFIKITNDFSHLETFMKEFKEKLQTSGTKPAYWNDDFLKHFMSWFLNRTMTGQLATKLNDADNEKTRIQNIGSVETEKRVREIVSYNEFHKLVLMNRNSEESEFNLRQQSLVQLVSDRHEIVGQYL